jgi:hypothetical protein
VWSASGDCDARIVSSGGYRTEWDLVLERRGKGPVWIADLALGDARLTLKPPLEAEGDVPGLLAVAPEASEEKPEPAPEPPPATAVQAESAGLMAEAGNVRLDEVYATEQYRHVDFSIDDLACLDGQWPRVKLKICWGKKGSYIELRRMDGWPDMFVKWPSEERDDFGDVWKIGEGFDVGELKLSVERDRLLLQAIGTLLRTAVEAALASGRHRPDVIEFWSGEARGVARFLAERLQGSVGQSVVPV